MTTKKKPTTVGNRIEEARTSYRMSQAQLAIMLKKTRAAVSLYEQDKIAPRSKVIERLAEVFGAAPEWFAHGRGAAPKPVDHHVTIPEIDVALITPTLTDLRHLRTGKEWSLPASIFNCAITPNHMMVAFESADHVYPLISAGDRVVVDLQRRMPDADGPGVFLAYVADDRQCGAHLCGYTGEPIGADILGRVVALFRAV